MLYKSYLNSVLLSLHTSLVVFKLSLKQCSDKEEFFKTRYFSNILSISLILCTNLLVSLNCLNKFCFWYTKLEMPFTLVLIMFPYFLLPEWLFHDWLHFLTFDSNLYLQQRHFLPITYWFLHLPPSPLAFLFFFFSSLLALLTTITKKRGCLKTFFPEVKINTIFAYFYLFIFQSWRMLLTSADPICFKIMGKY